MYTVCRLALTSAISNKQKMVSKLHDRWSLDIVRLYTGVVSPRGMHRYGNSATPGAKRRMLSSYCASRRTPSSALWGCNSLGGFNYSLALCSSGLARENSNTTFASRVSPCLEVSYSRCNIFWSLPFMNVVTLPHSPIVS